MSAEELSEIGSLSEEEQQPEEAQREEEALDAEASEDAGAGVSVSGEALGVAGLYNADTVNDEVFEELRLGDAIALEVEGSWAAFLRGAGSHEASRVPGASRGRSHNHFGSSPKLRCAPRARRRVALRARVPGARRGWRFCGGGGAAAACPPGSLLADVHTRRLALLGDLVAALPLPGSGAVSERRRVRAKGKARLLGDSDVAVQDPPNRRHAAQVRSRPGQFQPKPGGQAVRWLGPHHAMTGGADVASQCRRVAAPLAGRGAARPASPRKASRCVPQPTALRTDAEWQRLGGPYVRQVRPGLALPCRWAPSRALLRRLLAV